MFLQVFNLIESIKNTLTIDFSCTYKTIKYLKVKFSPQKVSTTHQQQDGRVPDVVVAELGGLRPVQQHRPRRGVYRIRLGSGPGHLIVCLAVPGGRARGSCTVGWMGERRG